MQDYYVAEVDGQTVLRDGYSEVDLFQQELYSSVNLALDLHTVTISNRASDPFRPWFDVDWATITVGDGDTSCVRISCLLSDNRAS